MSRNLIYVSNKGGTINSFRGDSGWLYRVCSNRLSLYCDDLLSAKAQLDRLETRNAQKKQQKLSSSNTNLQSLRELVETAAAPYLNHEFDL